MTIDDLVTLLRSKTALGRLADGEVKGVLTYLESIGLTLPVSAAAPAPTPAPVAAPAPIVAPVAAPAAAPTVAAPAPVAAPIAPTAAVVEPVAPIVAPAPVTAPAAPAAPSAVETLEAIIKKDIDAFLHPAAAATAAAPAK